MSDPTLQQVDREDPNQKEASVIPPTNNSNDTNNNSPSGSHHSDNNNNQQVITASSRTDDNNNNNNNNNYPKHYRDPLADIEWDCPVCSCLLYVSRTKATEEE